MALVAGHEPTVVAKSLSMLQRRLELQSFLPSCVFLLPLRFGAIISMPYPPISASTFQGVAPAARGRPLG